MSDKVSEYIEVYRTWKSGPASPKTYNQLVTLRESMTPEEKELLAIVDRCKKDDALRLG